MPESTKRYVPKTRNREELTSLPVLSAGFEANCQEDAHRSLSDTLTSTVEKETEIEQNYQNSFVTFDQRSTESDLDTEISNNFTIKEAIQLFICSSKLPLSSVRHLMDLLTIVKNLTAANPDFKLPSVNSLIYPPNKVIKETINLCPSDNSLLVDGKCQTCKAHIQDPDFLSIGDLQTQFVSLLEDPSFIEHVETTRKDHFQSGYTGDVYQGINYRSASVDSKTITLCLNSDGFQINSTSKSEP